MFWTTDPWETIFSEVKWNGSHNNISLLKWWARKWWEFKSQSLKAALSVASTNIQSNKRNDSLFDQKLAASKRESVSPCNFPWLSWVRATLADPGGRPSPSQLYSDVIGKNLIFQRVVIHFHHSHPAAPPHFFAKGVNWIWPLSQVSPSCSAAL